jgi:hypothetical protein
VEIEEQHPIPQQVSAYQFKLVGDMTLQQFFYVAGGALVALLFYSSNLASYIKWPFVIFSFLFGVALAFFPLEDRPLAKWVVLFVKAIYSPTLYVWKQLPVKYSFFQEEAVSAPQAQPTQIHPPQAMVASITQVSTKLEGEEKKFLDKIANYLSGIFPQTHTPATKLSVSKAPEPKIPVTGIAKVEAMPTKTSLSQAQSPSESLGVVSDDNQPTPITTQKAQGVIEAKFSTEAAPPLPPTKENVVVGQVVDSEGKIVESAILEIRDSEGRPARALRSNKLGHFMIVTPLENGSYEITTEKDGLSFEAISLLVKGEIIPPIAIWAKTKVQGDIPEPIKV